MENTFTNVTLNSSKPKDCDCGPSHLVFLSLINIFNLLVGQPVIARLLWITCTSKKTTDILNCNLAIFHNLEYFVLNLHLFVFISMPCAQFHILKFLFVYVQIGGPMSLSFVCVERYVAVIHPTSYPLLKKYRCREVCAGLVWLFSVPTAFASLFAREKNSSLTKTVEKIPFFVMALMTALMVRCSVSIAQALKHSGPGRDKVHPIKRRAFKTVCATSGMVLFCYVPVTLLYGLIVDNYLYRCLVVPGCLLLLSVASVVHPIFYLYTQGKLFICLK